MNSPDARWTVIDFASGRPDGEGAFAGIWMLDPGIHYLNHDEIDGSSAAGLVPPMGKALFYLLDYRDGHGPSGFGTEAVPLPLEPSSWDGGCPGEEDHLVGSGGTSPKRR